MPRNGFDMAVGIAMHNHKVMGDACQFADIEDDRIFAFFVIRSFLSE